MIKQLSFTSSVDKPDTLYLDTLGGDLPVPLSSLVGATTTVRLVDQYVAMAKIPNLMRDCRYIRTSTSNNQPRDGGYIALHSPNPDMMNALTDFF